MSSFAILKFVHVFSAMIAVGTNISYNLLLINAARRPETTVFTLKTIRFLDSRLANPSYAVTLLAGLWMAFAVPFPLMTPWILASIILYLLIAALGFGVYAPIFRKQLKLAESEGMQSRAYLQTARQGMTLIFIVTALVALIVFFMVVKPPLWSGWF
ncbi:MAG: DUF2269 domain-containing protein [Anaerolineales bacterium]|nr:DUF2269 domain-containing protein [Anaerolineales bacterium]